MTDTTDTKKEEVKKPTTTKPVLTVGTKPMNIPKNFKPSFGKGNSPKIPMIRKPRSGKA